ncbi:hypothetical protein BJ165DRAFT_1448604 [Panaeolus papilionaceus]|nr:hypothetical protein BJ165DRAFT_1448604 [Panaeolus papilionaceus]
MAVETGLNLYFHDRIMIFPEEILELIVNNFARRPPEPKDVLDLEPSTWAPLYIDNEAKKTLQNLCLTSRTCHRHAIRLLFHTIEITGNVTVIPRRAEQLLDMLSTESCDHSKRTLPSISTCIRYFAVRPSYNFLKLKRYRREPQKDFEIAYESQNFLSLLLHLTTTQHICIRGVYLAAPTMKPHQKMRWAELSPLLRSSIRRLIRNPQLEMLCFSRFSFLPHYIFNGISAKGLSVISYHGTTLQGPQEVIPEDPEEVEDARLLATLSRPSPDFFQTDHGFDMARVHNGAWPHNKICISSHISFRHQPAEHAKLLAATRGVEYLQVHITYLPWLDDESSFFAAFNFGHLSVLRTLSLSFSEDILNTGVRPYNPAAIVRLLGGQRCNNLQTLYLSLEFAEVMADDDFLVNLLEKPPFLDSVDEILSSDRYPVLRQLRLEISTDDDYCDAERTRVCTPTLLEARLHRLKGRGVELSW